MDEQEAELARPDLINSRQTTLVDLFWCVAGLAITLVAYDKVHFVVILAVSFVGSLLAAIDALDTLARRIDRRAEPILYASLARLAGFLIGYAFGSLAATFVCVVLVLNGVAAIGVPLYWAISATSLACGAIAGSFPAIGKRLSGVTGGIYSLLFSMNWS